LKDRILKGDSCNIKRRPDLYISSTKELHIIVECDEKQHQGYNASCESGRIDELLDEIKEGRVVIIRWNPDHYKVNKGVKKKRKERLKELKDFILDISNKKE